MELKEKVKKALIDSGFPLEMIIAKVLEDDGWNTNLGDRYVDFETRVLREIDIIANKSVNGIEVYLVIECKKSDNKQLVLYAPTPDRQIMHFLPPFRVFPKFKPKDNRHKNIWYQLPLFNDNIPLSNNIIFTKGDKVEQNNDSFFSSLNGMIKKSIDIGRDGFIDSEFRMMFLHLLIYDGVIYQLSNSTSEDFSLEEIKYGQYVFKYRFKFPSVDSMETEDIVKTANLFRFSNIIEILHPSHLKTYLQELQTAILAIPKKSFKGWGYSMEDYMRKNHIAEEENLKQPTKKRRSKI